MLDQPAPEGAAGTWSDPGSLDQYRLLIETLRDYAIFRLSSAGRIVSWNTGAQLIFGYERDEVLGHHYRMLFDADDRACGRPEAELRAAVADGKVSRDGWHIRKDGSRLWCTDTVQPVLDHSGAIAGFTKIVRDSTGYHSNLETLRQSEERFRLLVEGVTEYALFSVDVDGLISLWNSGAQKIFGYAGSEVEGKHFSLLYTQGAIARGVPAAELAAALRNGRADDTDWHVRKDGSLFYASGQTTQLAPDADGKQRGFVKVAHDITERNQAQEAIRRQAFHDALTGLPNRAYFSDCLQRAIAHLKRHPDEPFAVLYLDLDRFKEVNDRLGHTVADGLLRQITRRLESCVRAEDVVARLGGDEFTVLLGEVRGSEDARAVSDRIQTAFVAPFVVDGQEIYMSASIGIAIGSPSYDKAEDVLRDADIAMYEAKAMGRARQAVFDSPMHARVMQSLRLQTDLRHAVERHEFFLDYQPIVALGNGRVIGFEALVRWNHPERGLLMPAAFIAEAETGGLIVPLDRWVLNEACAQARTWKLDRDEPKTMVSVNLSSKHFSREALVTEVEEALNNSGLDPACLKLEITETALMENFGRAEATMRRLGELGVELHIDDFGTGYSSLSYLGRLPLRALKIDRSFVRDLPWNVRSTEIARTIVSLAHGLGLEALAEGVETEHQLAQLRALGCEYGQGYFFSEPVRPALAGSYIGRSLPL